MRVIVKFVVKLITIILYRVKIIGKENIPKTGAAIICPNHVHFWDAPTIVAYTKRKVNALAKEELFVNGFVKWLADQTGIYPIKRNSADLQAIKIALKVLKNDELLMLFPEGTRNGIAKGVKPKNGAVVIAAKAGVPIIPIGVNGSFKPFSKITIKIGTPIDYSKYKKEINNKELMTELTQELMQEIIKLTK